MAHSKRPAPEPYEVADAARTIHRAHQHMKDKHLMRHVKKHVKSSAKGLAAFAQALQGGQMGQGAAPQAQQPEPMGMEAFGP